MKKLLVVLILIAKLPLMAQEEASRDRSSIDSIAVPQFDKSWQLELVIGAQAMQASTDIFVSNPGALQLSNSKIGGDFSFVNPYDHQISIQLNGQRDFAKNWSFGVMGNMSFSWREAEKIREGLTPDGVVGEYFAMTFNTYKLSPYIEYHLGVSTQFFVRAGYGVALIAEQVDYRRDLTEGLITATTQQQNKAWDISSGWTTSMGVRWQLNHGLKLSTGFNLFAYRYSPSEIKVESYTVDGVDRLGDFSENQRTFLLKDNPNPQSGQDGTSLELQKPKHTFYDFGLFLGLSYTF